MLSDPRGLKFKSLLTTYNLANTLIIKIVTPFIDATSKGDWPRVEIYCPLSALLSIWIFV
jgi:hypothetical protein